LKKLRRTHLWIGLISSIFILMESITGLLINEPWLIGQSQVEGVRGNFQPGQFNGGQFNQGQAGNGTDGTVQGNEQGNGQGTNQFQGQSGFNRGQFQGQASGDENGNFAARMNRDGMGQGSFMGIIRGLHEGRIGNTNIKWLIDLIALAMIALTGTGIYLSIKVLRAESKRKKNREESINAQ